MLGRVFKRATEDSIVNIALYVTPGGRGTDRGEKNVVSVDQEKSRCWLSFKRLMGKSEDDFTPVNNVSMNRF